MIRPVRSNNTGGVGGVGADVAGGGSGKRTAMAFFEGGSCDGCGGGGGAIGGGAGTCAEGREINRTSIARAGAYTAATSRARGFISYQSTVTKTACRSSAIVNATHRRRLSRGALRQRSSCSMARVGPSRGSRPRFFSFVGENQRWCSTWSGRSIKPSSLRCPVTACDRYRQSDATQTFRRPHGSPAVTPC
jgi:hypothetical protein